MHRSSDFDRDPYRRAEHRDGFERAGRQLLDFLRSRTAGHWVMFLGGLVIGMILG